MCKKPLIIILITIKKINMKYGAKLVKEMYMFKIRIKNTQYK